MQENMNLQEELLRLKTQTYELEKVIREISFGDKHFRIAAYPSDVVLLDKSEIELSDAFVEVYGYSVDVGSGMDGDVNFTAFYPYVPEVVNVEDLYIYAKDDLFLVEVLDVGLWRRVTKEDIIGLVSEDADL